MKSNLPFLWVLPTWAAILAVYFIAAYFYLWAKGRLGKRAEPSEATNSLTREWWFAAEIRRFPVWHFWYQVVKWGTLFVAVGYFVWVFIYFTRR